MPVELVADSTTSAKPKSLRSVSLDDKYTAREGSIYLSGIQALC